MELVDQNDIEIEWLLGINAVEKIATLDSKYKSLFCEAKGLEEYNPWANFEKPSKLIKISKSNIYILKEQDLTTIKLFLKEGDSNLYKVGVRENHFGIDTEILKRRPETLSFLEKSCDLLFRTNEWIKPLFNTLIYNIIPIKIIQGGKKAGFSTIDARGLIFFSLEAYSKYSYIDLAIDFSHELGHQSLFVYQSSDEIFVNCADTKIYSPIKKKERPAIMAFHALMAISYMVYTTGNIKLDPMLNKSERLYCDKKLKDLQSMLSENIKSIKNSKLDLTPLGQILLNESTLLIQ